MTVAEAARFFRKHEDVQAKLAPLIDVGLEYLRLGQPVPTLSGGEAQRLKLAGHLRRCRLTPDGKLFLFDEPTTGLHFDDVAKLLRAFRQLLDAGHSLVVIEHNLDVIRASRLDHRPRARGRRRRRRRRLRKERPSRSRSTRNLIPARPCGSTKSAFTQALETKRTGRPLPRQRDPHPQRARAQPQEHRRRDPARPLHRGHRRLGLGQVHPRLRHPVRRGPAPLPGIAERLRAPVRAGGLAPGRRRDLRHPADGGDRAAHQPRRPQVAPSARSPRCTTSCACCSSSSARSTAPTATCRSSRRARK